MEKVAREVKTKSLLMSNTTRDTYLASICKAQEQLQRLTAAIDLCSDLPDLTDGDVTAMRSYVHSLNSMADLVESYSKTK